MSNRDHNRGQEDASRGVYEKPYSTTEEVVDLFNPLVSTEKFEENLGRNEDYKEGWNHGWNQK